MIEIKVPSPGESITQVQLASWLVADGDIVEKDQEIAEIDSDKATLTVSAEESGQIKLMAGEGDTIDVGSVICSIDTSKAVEKKAVETIVNEQKPVVEKTSGATNEIGEDKVKQEDSGKPIADEGILNISPLAAKMMEENNMTEDGLIDFLKQYRIGKKDIHFFLSEKDKIKPEPSNPQSDSSWGGTRDKDRKKMSMLRTKLAERLVSVKQETAMLTTFNEVNMTPIMEIRKKHKEHFKEKHGVGLGFMSFFTKAVTEALQYFPAVNAQIDGNEIVYHDYADIGIAVSSPKGLVVPVLRNAEQMSLMEIETNIKELAIKARNGKITIDEMMGGTYTITNGGVFGSMLSTPILNPPQSAILGMHNIVERPIAVNGKVEIHPMMYVAMSYDHRIIDGKESVGFLVKVKEMLEDPAKMLFGGKDGVEVLLGL
ncbi:MAG: 2-oxoglutarate dehydrogenase complex dihydrolipoyllysine-residue succinyltransferase [Chlorobi bacterium]|nr:2-oxoglutarate dehydrogenase complex dihydrolipoyllysine-residue succinyltransferase [Chlorobiota bacterium]